MDNSEKEILENLKNFDTTNLYTQESYAEFFFQGNHNIIYILGPKQNNSIEIYLNKSNRGDAPVNSLNFFGENIIQENLMTRRYFINPYIENKEDNAQYIILMIQKKLNEFNIKLDVNKKMNQSRKNKINKTMIINNKTGNNEKENILEDKNGKKIDITGYKLYQFLVGSLLDYFLIIKKNLKTGGLDNDFIELFMLILELIKYVINEAKNNINKYKNAYFNRKLLIASKIHAILVSLEHILINLKETFVYNYGKINYLEDQYVQIINSIYDIMLNIKDKNCVPWPCFVILLEVIVNEEFRKRSRNYKNNDVFNKFIIELENLNEAEIKYIRKNQNMFDICKNVIRVLCGTTQTQLIDQSYYTYLLSCLKCNNLETKMNALNDINDLINKFKDNEKRHKSFRDFIKQNNILEIIFAEGIHDEIVKRSYNIFVYFAKNNALENEFIEKIIERKNNNLMQKLVIKIISVLPKDKKEKLFYRLSKGIKFNYKSNNDIEFISELTIACFNKSSNEILIIEGTDKNFYGLNMIFNYIIKDFDDKIRDEENNVGFAVNIFSNTIAKIYRVDQLKINEVFIFVEKLFENIKFNNKHNSVIQSIKLIQFLIDMLKGKKTSENLILLLKNFDKRYDIVPLLMEDLIRYLNILPSNFSDNNIYEGIYPHHINIEERLKLIFYFFKKISGDCALDLSGKKYIEKIYQIFQEEKYKNEKKNFYSNFTKNIDEIDDKILSEFFSDILQNKSHFNLKKINDKESLNFIIQLFKTLNINKKSIVFDGKNIRVVGGVPIEGFNILFDILTQNGNRDVQNQISELLCNICINFKDYTSKEIPNYLRNYYLKIISCLDIINKTHDKIALNGILKLLNKIYSFTCDCSGKIPESGDYHSPHGELKTYHFEKIGGKIRQSQYSLRAGINDTISELRWKLGYYYDIPINNVTFIGIDNKSYNINNDFDNFVKTFSDPRYFGIQPASIKVKDEPFQFLKIKENPKDFIEKNENLYEILIQNLKIDEKNNEKDIEIEIKQKVWNILSKLPKKYYFEKRLIKFGDSVKNDKLKLEEYFNVKEIYIMTYSLQCFDFFLFELNEPTITKDMNNNINQLIWNKNTFLNNFINIYSPEKIILECLLNTQLNKEKCKLIEIENISIMIKVLLELYKYKQKDIKEKFENIYNDKNIYDKIIKKLTEILIELLEFNYLKYNNYLNQFNDDINENKKNNKNNKNNLDIKNIIAKLIENIFIFIEYISKDKTPYMLYLFNNTKLFFKIFVNDYIKSDSDLSRKVIENYLDKNYGKNNEYIKKFLEIILTVDIFNYLVKNDVEGKYFHVISFIMKKYEENLNKNIMNKIKEKNDSQYYKQSKQIIDIIIDYILKECEKDDNNIDNEINSEKETELIIKKKEYFKEGILLFLTDLIKLNSKELVIYITNKIDFFDLFINKCLLRKCIEKPLESKNPFCLTNQSQNPVYNLIIIILKNIPNNESHYSKIISYLNKYHEKSFWKKFNHENWDLNSNETPKTKYIGLKNMSSTCYLNSIIQQLYMIPMFRETILKIENPSKTNILYELQLLFSALKIYEFGYYDPRSFVVANKLNFYEQMDADEFYGSLIDKIENDIRDIYLGKKEKKENDNYKYKNIFNYFFGIKVLDELKFVDCNHKRYNEFFYNSIQLEIKGFNNIYDSLKNYVKTEIMDGDNKINCEKCKVKRTCHKHLIFKSLPNILVIILKRFEFDYNAMVKYKLNKYFEFPFNLDMKEFLYEDNKTKELNTEYELRGITIHFGVADFGHYYDLIKGPDNKWYKFNDISVTQFKEEDIAKEAFGEKEIFEEDSSKEKENGKNNAYILIYKKTNFNQNSIDKYKENELAIPPYNKYSNINDDLKNAINYKLYKSWTIKTLASEVYQNFIISLLKFDIAKIYSPKIEKNFISLFRILKEEKYIIENPNNNINTPYNPNSAKLFVFALRYYFGLFIRISKRYRGDKINELFKQLIRLYILSDIKRAKYLLEEFSNAEVIDEYLTYCPNIESVKLCLSLIIEGYKYIYDETKFNQNDTFVYCLMNNYIMYIASNIRDISMDATGNLLLKMIEIGGDKFLIYLRGKRFTEWISTFYGEKRVFKDIFNTDLYPIIKSDHCILSEKNNNNKIIIMEDNDLYQQQFVKNLKDLNANSILVKQLSKHFHIFS